MRDLEEDSDKVEGERDSSAVSQAPSVQSRVSNVLAIGLMSVLGLGMLTWYYANAITHQSQAQKRVQAQSSKKASGDVPLPSLGKIDPPSRPPDGAAGIVPSPASLPPTPLQEIPLQQTPSASSVPYGPPAIKSPEQLALERQLSGAVFSPQSAAPSPTSGFGPPSPETGAPDAGNLSALLKPSVTPAAHAQLLPSQRLLLPKGAFLDCTLETAIDSTLPGMTTCVMATDIFGVDGQVVLLERGTKLVGETRGQVQQGSARVFVLWNEARTPTGVVVPLASPGADELGRSGLAGSVNRHFWERFGAAILVSVIDGGIQGAMQSGRNSSGTVIVNPSATQDITTEVLKGTVNIVPTVTKRQGDRIQVLVARDLDFRSVYELRSVAN
jgi:type IV secretion system protein VirB10